MIEDILMNLVVLILIGYAPNEYSDRTLIQIVLCHLIKYKLFVL